MDLSELREQIDVIDARIVALYEQRMDLCRQVAEYKINTGKKVFDRQREAEKLAKVAALNWIRRRPGWCSRERRERIPRRP